MASFNTLGSIIHSGLLLYCSRSFAILAEKKIISHTQWVRPSLANCGIIGKYIAKKVIFKTARQRTRNSFIHCCGFNVTCRFLLSVALFMVVSFRVSPVSDHRPMFVLVSLFLVFLPVFRLLLSAEYHTVLLCFSLCGQHKTTVCFSGCLALLFPLHTFSVVHQCLWYEKSN